MNKQNQEYQETNEELTLEEHPTDVKVEATFGYTATPTNMPHLFKSERTTSLSVCISATNIEEVLTALRNKDPALRGMSSGRIVTLAFYEFCKNKGIDLKMTARSARELRNMYKYVGAFF